MENRVGKSHGTVPLKEMEQNMTELVRVKRDDYTEYKWAPGYVVGTSPQVSILHRELCGWYGDRWLR
jgi:hypothetical protein